MVDKIWYNMEELIGGSEERVLIETYWNVNEDVQLFMKRLRKGINRNILECKYFLTLLRKIPRNRINRNILECKCVLLTSVPTPDDSINRNILECK